MNEGNQGKENEIWLAEEIWDKLEILLSGLVMSIKGIGII